MAPKYIRNLHLPDKAIGWLDTAAVKVEINEPQTMVVTPDHVIDVISQESRIPRDMIFRDTSERFSMTEAMLGATRYRTKGRDQVRGAKAAAEQRPAERVAL